MSLSKGPPILAIQGPQIEPVAMHLGQIYFQRKRCQDYWQHEGSKAVIVRSCLAKLSTCNVMLRDRPAFNMTSLD